MGRFCRGQRGFTLVELVLVIVVMGIMAFGTVQFILNTSQSYTGAARWERLGSSSRVTVERIARELRNALPNSVRVGSSPAGIPCLEFVPVLAGSHYLDLPVGSASTGFRSVPFAEPPPTGRVAVYPLRAANVDPLHPANVYRLATTAEEASVVSPEPVITASAALVSSGPVTVSWASSHAFPSESPGKRWFMVDEPVSLCLLGGRLFRYESYGFSADQPFPGGGVLPGGVPARQLLATSVSTEGKAFEVVPPSLTRNALIQLDLSFKQGGEGVRIQHEVQLRNVP